jgi:hypothetical protein
MTEHADNSRVLVRLRLFVAAAGLLACLTAAPAFAAKEKPLLATYNEGLEPHAELQAHSKWLTRPSQLRVVMDGAVPSEVKGWFTVECRVGKSRSQKRRYTLSGFPAERKVRVRGKWDRCRIDKAEARYVDSFIEGWVQIRAWGTSR